MVVSNSNLLTTLSFYDYPDFISCTELYIKKRVKPIWISCFFSRRSDEFESFIKQFVLMDAIYLYLIGIK